jgi:hypothetical protein
LAALGAIIMLTFRKTVHTLQPQPFAPAQLIARYRWPSWSSSLSIDRLGLVPYQQR